MARTTASTSSCNPRIGATVRLFVDTNGIDVARALYTISILRYLRDGRLTPTNWLRSFRGIDESA
jgi:hypothetical protein